MKVIQSDAVCIGKKEALGGVRGYAYDQDFSRALHEEATINVHTIGNDTFWLVSRKDFKPQFFKRFILFPPSILERFETWAERSAARLQDAENQ